MKQLAKSINSILNLRDNFSKTLGQTAKNTKAFQQQVKASQNEIKKLGANITSSFKSMAKGALGLATAYIGFSSAKRFITESIEIAKSAAVNEERLQAVLKSTKGVTDEQIKSIKAYASELSQVGVISNTVALAGVQQLGAFNLQADTIKTLLPAMEDYAAQQKGLNATQEDMIGYAKLFGKMMNGQTGALTRLGMSLTKAEEQTLKYGTETQKAALIAKKFEDSIGGTNAALGQTDAAKIIRLTNNIRAFKKEVGNVLIPLQGLLAGVVGNAIPKVQKAVIPLLTNFRGLLEQGVNKLTRGWEVLKNHADELKAGLTILLPAVVGVTAALKSFSVLTSISKGIKILTTATKGLALAQIKLKFAFLGNPIFWVALAIGALTAKFVVAYRTSEAFRNKVNALLDKFKAFAVSLRGPVLTGIKAAGGKLKEVAGWVNTKVIPPILHIGQSLKKLRDEFAAPLFKFFKAIFTPGLVGAFTFVRGAFSTTIGIIKGQAENLLKIFSGITDFITGVFTGDWKFALNGLANSVSGTFGVLKTTVKGFVNFTIDSINGLTSGINNLTGKIKGVPGFGWASKLNIPQIPHLALGTSYFKGGMAQVNERGGEIIGLPNGSKVIPADKSERSLGRGDINLYLTIQGNVIGNEAFINQVGAVVTSKVKMALTNM